MHLEPMSHQYMKDHASVDSSTGTVVPVGSSSVQSTLSYDSLSVAFSRFTRSPGSSTIRIRRQIVGLIRKFNVESMESFSQDWDVSVPPASKRSGKSQTTVLAISSDLPKRSVPSGNLLMPPRGNLVCGTRELYREVLVMRRLTRAQRSIAAARLIRTLDPNLATHCDIALSLFLIATL